MLSDLNRDLLLALNGVAAATPVVSLLAIFIALWLPYLVIGVVVMIETFTQDDEKKMFRRLFRIALPSSSIWLIVVGIKHVVPAPRPFVSDLDVVPLVSVPDLLGSFPSAHAAIFGALFGTMIARKEKFAKWFGIAALIIAIGRVATGVHWPFDVIVGLFFGTIAGCLGEKLLLHMNRKNYTTKPIPFA